jgi:two-component system, OmpR family, sensor kinase
VQAAADAARAHADEQGVSLEVHTVEAVVLGAPGPLRRVVDSLVDNALTHTPAGGRVRLRVSAGPAVTLEVIDTGSGIDPAMSSTLFDRFAHGTSTRERRHYGLGLAMVREIVRAHGGTVSAGATPGGGATFTVVLPPA